MSEADLSAGGLRAQERALREEAARAWVERQQLVASLPGVGGGRRKALAALAEVAGCRATRCRQWADHVGQVADELVEAEAPPAAPSAP